MADKFDDATTDFTSTIHREPYPAISPTKPSLSQAGKTVLITGGGVGVGKYIAHNFVLASVATIVIVGRRVNKLQETASELEATGKQAGHTVKVIFKGCDVTDDKEVERVWDDLAKEGVYVDVLVLNSAKDTASQTLFELGYEEVWAQFEANVKGPLHFAERFYKQSPKGAAKTKYLLNVSTAAIHMHGHPLIDTRPAYSVTKGAGTLTIQTLANRIPPEDMQILSYHPGSIYGRAWEDQGISRDAFPFDDDNLPGAFAVWAASKEASFLHGRYVFASWDVEELARGEFTSCFDADRDYLRITVKGLDWMKKI
ncbi:NAD(P)-binding protein [Periconia macrospinosa]|uniref:NAD(P)-binding protein n=1 Tax=Periconia macrospinosa TaxID=97972 RepID=A0A2V1DJI3_9PLEO|nr:NAD(P)-binding protein [Periconia macrospinosa]